MCTGSTDTEGVFLLWAHRTFGVKRATICLSPPFVAFDSRALEKLPLRLVFTIICPVVGRQVNFAATKLTPNALCLNAGIECTGIYRST